MAGGGSRAARHSRESRLTIAVQIKAQLSRGILLLTVLLFLTAAGS
jgi:hypothetical protein